jgi:hypothetical protein
MTVRMLTRSDTASSVTGRTGAAASQSDVERRDTSTVNASAGRQIATSEWRHVMFFGRVEVRHTHRDNARVPTTNSSTPRTNRLATARASNVVFVMPPSD